MTIDRTAPAVSGPTFEFETAQDVRFPFNDDVLASVDQSDLTLVNQTTSRTTPSGSLDLSLTGAPGTPTTANYAANVVLADGHYQATLPAGSIVDRAGNALASALNFSFFIFGGDANRDERIDSLDFNALAANFGFTGRTFSQGDFSCDGKVDTIDFNILATNFGTTLAGDALPAKSSTHTPVLANGSMRGARLVVAKRLFENGLPTDSLMV